MIETIESRQAAIRPGHTVAVRNPGRPTTKHVVTLEPCLFNGRVVVGIRTSRMPRCAVAAANPTKSSTAPPPMATT